jgi:hypothetical protein
MIIELDFLIVNKDLLRFSFGTKLFSGEFSLDLRVERVSQLALRAGESS